MLGTGPCCAPGSECPQYWCSGMNRPRRSRNCHPHLTRTPCKLSGQARLGSRGRLGLPRRPTSVAITAPLGMVRCLRSVTQGLMTHSSERARWCGIGTRARGCDLPGQIERSNSNSSRRHADEHLIRSAAAQLWAALTESVSISADLVTYRVQSPVGDWTD